MVETRGLSIAEAKRRLVEGELSAETLTTACLDRIADRTGEGAAAFIEVYREKALAESRAADLLHAGGRMAGPLAGIPISIKDLFDVAGSVTRAGSAVLRDAPPAQRDATAVARLRAAGAVIVGRTNLSEFAFTGLGLNPHYGTPRAPYGRERGYAPGGSSSGCAVSVSDGMALAGIGTDTGGSGRIPAAFCGIVGFKPTRGAIPMDGTFALASSFDTVSPMANTVADCRLVFEILSGRTQEPTVVEPAPLRIGVLPWQELGTFDEDVASTFETSLASLEKAGARIEPVVDFDWHLPGRILQEGRVTAVEGLVAHGELFARRAEYDPRVAARFAQALGHPATAYANGLRRMQAAHSAAAPIFARYDAMLLPTVPINPPALDTLADDETFQRINLQALRHTLIVNVLDGCAVSLPVRRASGPPGALMLMAPAGYDARLLDIAEYVEATLCSHSSA